MLDLHPMQLTLKEEPDRGNICSIWYPFVTDIELTIYFE